MNLAALILTHAISLTAACHALLTKKNPRSALGWTVVLVFLPVIGLAVYLIFGISRSQSRAEKIMRRIAELARQYPQAASCENLAPATNEGKCLASLGRRLSATDLCGGNRVIPLHNGDEAYPAMLAAIENASDHVFLSTYIFNYGQAAEKFIRALTEAHARGVDTRVLVDGIGALYSWKKPWEILAASGVKTTRFRPPELFPPKFGINLRSHRKVLVCDGTGFTGGMNIADGNILALPGTAHIQDMQFQFNGPIVAQLRQAFLLNWSFCTGSFSPLPAFSDGAAGNCLCRVIVDGPGNDADALYDLICGAISLARKTIRIMTPYFLPPCELTGALRSAAQRGVDARVILPAKNNLDYMNWATHRVLPALLQAGVRVWFQPPPFAHTKLFAMDGYYSLIGSANLDSRSLKLNFELDTEIYDQECHDKLVSFMDATIAKSAEITLAQLRSASLPRKLRDAISWIFSPYF